MGLAFTAGDHGVREARHHEVTQIQPSVISYGYLQQRLVRRRLLMRIIEQLTIAAWCSGRNS